MIALVNYKFIMWLPIKEGNLIPKLLGDDNFDQEGVEHNFLQFFSRQCNIVKKAGHGFGDLDLNPYSVASCLCELHLTAIN